MPRSVFLTTTPNQRNFVRQLSPAFPQGLILKCDGFGPADYRNLPVQLGKDCMEAWIPYYGSVDGVHCAEVLRKNQPDLHVHKYYESLISYFVHPWFSRMYADDAGLNQAYHAADTRDVFVGVRELDQAFGRLSDERALPFDAVYPEQLIPDDLAPAQGVFIGQPLVEDTSLDAKSYTEAVLALVHAGLIDTYIQHPREKLSFNFPLKLVRLEHPVECYRSLLSQVPLYSIFSTATAYFSLFHKNVHIVDIDTHHLTISPWAQAVYAWLKEKNITFSPYYK